MAVVGGPIVLVAGRAKAATMRVRAYGELPYPIFPCAALPDDELIAIAVQGVANCVPSRAYERSAPPASALLYATGRAGSPEHDRRVRADIP
jgi:hypothetical protein